MMPMHLRYGSWCHHHGEHQCIDIDMYRQTQMVRWSSWSKARLRNHGLGVSKFAARFLFCCYTSKMLHFTQIVLMLRKPSLANGRKGDEQMQEVSLVSPLLVSFADIGDKLVKTVAALWYFFSPDVPLLKSLIDSRHLKQSRSKEKIFRPWRLSHLRPSSS